MTEPRTEAGKRLLADLNDLDTTGAAPTGDYLGPTGVLRAIVAIEDEASALDLDALRAAIDRGLGWDRMQAGLSEHEAHRIAAEYHSPQRRYASETPR
jgi:hypothetical protein